MNYDVVIVGGGPGGLSAALLLGRARKRVLLCDAGPRRNARAAHLQNFVTRDGTPPSEFRRIGREQLTPYGNVEAREQQVAKISGQKGAFQLSLADGAELTAQRVLLCAGMLDVLPDIPGFAEHWGSSIFQCPYCHGWEVQEQRFAVLAASVEMLDFAPLLRGWTKQLVALTNGAFAVPEEARARLAAAGVTLEERPLARLAGAAGQLERLEFAEGAPLDVQVLFARPAQKQVPLIEALGLALDPQGYVQVDAMKRETSVPGIFAAGDLTTPMQGAVLAAGSAVQASAWINHELTIEQALAGTLSSG